MEPGAEDELRAERERLLRVSDLGDGAWTAADAISPEDGEDAAGLAGAAERSLAPLEAAGAGSSGPQARSSATSSERLREPRQ